MSNGHPIRRRYVATIAALCCALSGSGAVLPARAEDSPDIRAFTQSKAAFLRDLKIVVPLSFAHKQAKPDFEAEDEMQSLVEFVPAGETVYEWTEMVSVRRFARDLFRGAKPGQVLDIVAQNIYGACPSSFVYQPLSVSTAAGAPAASALMGCRSTEHMVVPGLELGQAEVGVYTVIELPTAYVEAHYSRRTGDIAAFDDSGDPAVAAVVSGFVSGLAVCDADAAC
jgi:hypothetical protein